MTSAPHRRAHAACPHCGEQLLITTAIARLDQGSGNLAIRAAGTRAEPIAAAPTAAQQPVAAPAPAEPAGDPEPVCPDHGISRRSEKHPGYYCPTQAPAGGWCRWKSSPAAARV